MSHNSAHPSRAVWLCSVRCLCRDSYNTPKSAVTHSQEISKQKEHGIKTGRTKDVKAWLSSNPTSWFSNSFLWWNWASSRGYQSWRRLQAVCQRSAVSHVSCSAVNQYVSRLRPVHWEDLVCSEW
jgi:hypothetical protein